MTTDVLAERAREWGFATDGPVSVRRARNGRLDWYINGNRTTRKAVAKWLA